MPELTIYEKFKAFLKKHKQKIVYGAAFVLVFIIGFGSGRAGKEFSNKPQNQNNYSKYNTSSQPAAKPQNQPAGENQAPATQTKGAATNASSTCVVKGNIGSGGTKIYHVKGGAFYSRVQPEQCFDTEIQAQAAGYRKSSQ